LVGAGLVREPASRPSVIRIIIRRREERVERRDGRERRWSGRRVVGRILAVSGLARDEQASSGSMQGLVYEAGRWISG